MLASGLNFLLAVILSATLLSYGFASKSTNECSEYNQECDPSESVPCCDATLTCKLKESRLDYVCIESAKLGSPCDNDENCNEIMHAKCSKNECVCRPNNRKMNETHCAPLLGAFCWNGEACADPHAVCTDRVCQCKENHSCVDDLSLPQVSTETPKEAEVKIGSHCKDDRTCRKIKYSICSVAKKCYCEFGTDFVSVGTCKSNLGAACRDHFDCKIKGSYCLNNECRCDLGYKSYYGECYLPHLGMPCTSNWHCHQMIADSVCSSQSKCTCFKSFYPVNDTCVLELNASCSKAGKCHNSHFDCIDNQCQCKPNYKFWNFQCIPVVLGESCRNDIDCLALRFARCSDHGKCVCIDNYQDVDGKICAPLLGERCLENKDCQSLNSICINNRCSCDSNTTIALSQKCFPKQLGMNCDNSQDCFLLPNSECSGQRCVCSLGHFQQSRSRCAPLLGRSCSETRKCAVANSVCVADICQCRNNYVEVSDEYCMPIGLNKTCIDETDCPSFAYCSAKEYCTCEPNYGAMHGQRCAALLTKACQTSTSCGPDNSVCLNEICQCRPNYVNYLNVICKLDYLDEFCLTDSDCSETRNSVCSETGKCVCDRNHMKVSNICKPLLGGECSMDEDCLVQNSVCRSRKCECKLSYQTISNYQCDPVSLGSKCQFDSDCQKIVNSKCSSDKVCVCKEKYATPNAFACLPLLGGRCTHDHQCYSYSMRCADQTCQCKPNLIAASDNLCVEPHLRFSCQVLSECGDSWHFTCSTGKCVCQKNNAAFSNSTCLPILGGLCWKDDQCQAGNSICVDYHCKCKPLFVAVADNFCAYKG